MDNDDDDADDDDDDDHTNINDEANLTKKLSEPNPHVALCVHAIMLSVVPYQKLHKCDLNIRAKHMHGVASALPLGCAHIT